MKYNWAKLRIRNVRDTDKRDDSKNCHPSNVTNGLYARLIER